MRKVKRTLSNMESTGAAPSPREAAAALADAQHRRDSLAEHVVVPRLFFGPIGVAVAFQIGATATGLAGEGGSGWLVVAGFAVFVAVSAIQLARFRNRNGVWLGGLVSRVFGGTAAAASTSYAAALAGALWAALAGVWWLVPLCAAAGGAAYASSGRRWMRLYRSEPSLHGPGESAVWLAVVAALSVAGLVLLVGLR
jgi:hypothetical protein